MELVDLHVPRLEGRRATSGVPAHRARDQAGGFAAGGIATLSLLVVAGPPLRLAPATRWTIDRGVAASRAGVCC
jgi:hypothetical protein